MKDLHIHTKYSDGEDDEFEIVDKILQTGIDEFAICDHDTIEGSRRVFEVLQTKKIDIKFHSGVEFTSRVKDIFGGVNVHLLARDFDFDDKGIKCLVKEISQLRVKKIQKMVDFIYKTYNILLKNEEIDEITKVTKTVGKPHMYKLLCKYGDFDRKEYYANMDNLRTDDLRLDALNVLKIVNQGNGNVTLAHPKEIMREHNLTYEDIDRLVGHLVKYGLYGLETRHSSHTQFEYLKFAEIADKYNLVQSSGSDYHGHNVKPNVYIGVCEQKDLKL